MQATRYAAAEALLAMGRFDEAEAAFEALTTYSDARDRVKQVRYARAEANL